MQTKIIALDKTQLIKLLLFLFLFNLSIAAPLLRSQFLTGPLVNAILFLSSNYLGIAFGIILGTFPSFIALKIGTLPSPLAPMIPFIILSNMILVTVFFILKNKNIWAAIISSAFLKFLFLFSISQTLFLYLNKSIMAEKFIRMFSYPQLLTALGGGGIFILIKKIIKN